VKWGEERGVTLVEFLTVMAMLVILLGATVPLLFATTNQSSNQSSRITSIDGGRVALDRITRETRQACTISPTSGSTGVLTETVLVNTTAGYLSTCADYSPAGSLHTIRYDCTQASAIAGAHKCVRTDVTANTSAALIDGVTNAAQFTISGSTGAHPQVGISLQMLPKGATRPVVLEDTATATLATL
jgi:type II secretory pathway pseudopilin PulG